MEMLAHTYSFTAAVSPDPTPGAMWYKARLLSSSGPKYATPLVRLSKATSIIGTMSNIELFNTTCVCYI